MSLVNQPPELVIEDEWHGLIFRTNRIFGGSTAYQSLTISKMGVIESMNADTLEEAKLNHQKLIDMQQSVDLASLRGLDLQKRAESLMKILGVNEKQPISYLESGK